MSQTNIEILTRAMTAAEGMAADAALGKDGSPENVARHSFLVIASMVIDEQGNNRFTPEEVSRLPDGIVQEFAGECMSRREVYQKDALKNYEAASDALPTVSLQNLAPLTSTECLRNSQNHNSSNGQGLSVETETPPPPVTRPGGQPAST